MKFDLTCTRDAGPQTVWLTAASAVKTGAAPAGGMAGAARSLPGRGHKPESGVPSVLLLRLVVPGAAIVVVIAVHHGHATLALVAHHVPALAMVLTPGLHVVA